MYGQLKIESEITKIVLDSIEKANKAGLLNFSTKDISSIEIDIPKEEKYGDYSINTAMKMSKIAKMKPREIAEIIIDNIEDETSLLTGVAIAGPGFINFYISQSVFQNELSVIIEAEDDYGRIRLNEKKTINIEYVSANPTGPLHLGNARGAAIGDVLANIFDTAGWKVTKEFYLNDSGNQIIKFAQSLNARFMQIFDPSFPFPEDGYQGKDIITLAENYRDIFGDSVKDLDEKERSAILSKYALENNVERMRRDLSDFGVNYDVWFYESKLYEGAIEKIIELLNNNNATYEKDGALWFRASNYGCEKDEVLVRSNLIPTYYAADIAYHYNKLAIRNFDIAVDVWGADHHGHIQRVKSALEAAGIDSSRLKVILMQLVHLIDGDEALRLSKRKGQIVELSDLISEVGSDAARFIFNMNNASTHLDFDLGLAISQSNENPIWYVQYAHARMKSILRNVECTAGKTNFSLLTEKPEIALIKKLCAYSKEISSAAKEYDPSRITKYAIDLASHFHTFYNSCRVKHEDENLRRARLGLVTACSYVLKNTLTVIGIVALEQM